MGQWLCTTNLFNEGNLKYFFYVSYVINTAFPRYKVVFFIIALIELRGQRKPFLLHEPLLRDS